MWRVFQKKVIKGSVEIYGKGKGEVKGTTWWRHEVKGSIIEEKKTAFLEWLSSKGNDQLERTKREENVGKEVKEKLPKPGK